MINCSNWVGEIVVWWANYNNCIIDNNFLHSYSLFYWGLIYVWSFMLFLPIIIYFLIVNGLIKTIYSKNPDLEKKWIIKFFIWVIKKIK